MSPSSGFDNHKFFGVRLDEYSSRSELIDRVFISSRKDKFSYLVTPNVDHVVKLNEEANSALRALYGGADVSICDSRVLALFARALGRNLFVYPGSDIVNDMLVASRAGEFLIGIVGPSEQDFRSLAFKFPNLNLCYFSSPVYMEVGSEEFFICADEVALGRWDILLVCLGFPKQEMFVEAMRRSGRASGMALCIGASIDFLVGKQSRAPLLMQRLSLEWLFRLVSSPRRLWRRYLLGIPAILRLFWRFELLPRVGRGGRE